MAERVGGKPRESVGKTVAAEKDRYDLIRQVGEHAVAEPRVQGYHAGAGGAKAAREPYAGTFTG